MSKRKSEELKMALRSAAKTFSADKDVMIGFTETGPGAATDTGKAMVIRDPDVLVEHYGISMAVSEMIAKSSMTHEAAHIKFKTNIIEFNRDIIKAVKLGADRELAFRCINLAEDMRIDWLMGAERPGYLDMRLISAKDLIEKLYKRAEDMRFTAHLWVTAKLHDVTLPWDMGADWQAKADKAVAIFEAAKSAKTQEEGAKLGWEAYVTLYGMPTPRTTEEEREGSRIPLPTTGKPLTITHDFDEDDEDAKDDYHPGDDEDSIDDADDMHRDMLESDDEEDSDDGEDAGDSSDEDSDGSDSDDRGDLGDAHPGKDTPDDGDVTGDLWDDETVTADDMDAETDSWLKGKGAAVLHGDGLAEGLEDASMARKIERDARFMRGDALLAKQQEREKPRSYIERNALSVEIENLYSVGDNAGVQMWYTKPKTVDGWVAERKLLKHEKTIPAMVNTLTQTFKDVLRKGRERDTYLHRSGSVRADRVWRGSKLGDGRIFTRHEEKAAGGYAVKLLLDASGSMGGKDRECAIVAYVIAKSLLNAGMSVSVEAFDAGNSSCGVVHSVLLPWNDGNAERIFGYHAMNENRDGYSIRAAAHDLSSRQERNKILIVMSDGQPCHGGRSEAIMMAGGCAEGYGAQMNADAAKAVREVRAKGTKVLGVYFGYGRNLVEQEIYGRDFVPVTELARFADAVRGYLSRIIMGV